MGAASVTTVSGSLPRLAEVVEAVRQLDKELPAHVLLMLLTVAQSGDEGVLQHELAQKVGMDSGMACRHVARLGPNRGVGLPGMGLLDSEIVPENRKLRRVKLSAKGRRFIERLNKILDGKE